MSRIARIIIDFDNLTEEEQVKLWFNLFAFARDQLPKEKQLKCFIVDKTKKEMIQDGK